MRLLWEPRRPRWTTGTVIAADGRTVTVALPTQLAYIKAHTIPYTTPPAVGDTVNVMPFRTTWLCLGSATASAARPAAATAE